jgi:hypothetical protein
MNELGWGAGAPFSHHAAAGNPWLKTRRSRADVDFFAQACGEFAIPNPLALTSFHEEPSKFSKGCLVATTLRFLPGRERQQLHYFTLKAWQL